MKQKNINKLLKEAIDFKKKVKITYYDDPTDSDRLIYPHAIYKNENNIYMDAYQVSGYSATGKKFPKWKTFNVGDIQKAELLTEDFKIVKTFNPKSGKYSDVIVMVMD